MTWEERATQALADPKETITADATNITKFGAPAAALITSVAVVLLGENWQLDPDRSEVVIAAAVIAAAVMLGIYHAFATDVRTRGAVAVSRLEALTALAEEEMRRDVKRAEDADALKAANAEKETAIQERAEAQKALEVVRAELKECRQARKTAEKLRVEAQKADEDAKVEARIAELRQQLEACRDARDASKQTSESGTREPAPATETVSIALAAFASKLGDAVSEMLIEKLRELMATQAASTPAGVSRGSRQREAKSST